MSSQALPTKLLRQCGFFLIETMVSFALMSVGLLVLAGMQISVSRNADVSKQRVEAMRLAQERVETMRAFTHIAPTPGGAGSAATPLDPDRAGGARLAWTQMASDVDVGNPLESTQFSNTRFDRRWTVGGLASDAMRPISVTVKWTDRAGAAQFVTLNSVISQSDPTTVAALGFPLPNNTNLKLPKNRVLNIPVPAIELGGGASAYQISSSLAIVFNNLTGNVVQKCSSTVTAATYASGAAGCTVYNAYIVAGNVSGSIDSATPPTRPSGINTNQVSYGAPGEFISCSYAQTKDQVSGAVIAGSHYYLCVVPVAATTGTWSGVIRLGGVPTTASYKVCRLEYPGDVSDTTDMKNTRNIQPYVAVNASLDNQNYVLDSSANASCPVVSGLQTILHQDCRSSNPSRATSCPTTASNTPAG